MDKDTDENKMKKKKQNEIVKRMYDIFRIEKRTIN